MSRKRNNGNQRMSAYQDAKSHRRTLEKNLKALKIKTASYQAITPEYLAVREEVLKATEELTAFNQKFRIDFKHEIDVDRLATIRQRNTNRDMRLATSHAVSAESVHQKQLFDQLHQGRNVDTARDKRLAGIAFEASGLGAGQRVTIWRRPVLILAPCSSSQVRVLNEGIGIHSFESLDRYEAIAEANHKAIEAALFEENKPPPAPAKEEKPPVAAPEPEHAPMLNL